LQYTKSVHMANQQAWYSHMLNLRIRVQGLVAAANRLPPAAAVPLAEDASTATDAQKEVVAPHELRAGYEAASSSVAPAYSSALRGASRLLEDLFSLQSALLAQNTRIWASSQQDNAADDGEEAADNEDPETAEARLPKWQGLQGGKKRKRGVDDNEGGASDAEDDNDDASTVAAAEPEGVLSAYWDYLSGSVTPFLRPVQDALIDKWNNKTQLQAGLLGGAAGAGTSFANSGLKSGGAGSGAAAAGLKAINQSVLAQIEQLMLDRERLVKRSQLDRTAAAVATDAADEDENGQQPKLLGRVVAERTRAAKRARRATAGADDEDDEHLQAGGRLTAPEQYDASIYDDNDYYQQLLAEIISSASGSASGEAGAGGTGQGHDATLLAKAAAAARRKAKRGGAGGLVDRRASKGRKMRYTVHAKLANFMAPRAAPIADDYAARAAAAAAVSGNGAASSSASLLTGSGFAMDELFMNLFGGQGKKLLAQNQQLVQQQKKQSKQASNAMQPAPATA